MDSKFKGNGISLGFSGSAAASRTHLPSLESATRRVKDTIRASSNSPHFSIKSCISCIARDAIYVAVGRTFNEKSPFALRISKPLPRFNKSCSRSCVNFLSQEGGWTMPCHHQPGHSCSFNEVHIPRPSHLPRVLSIDEFKGKAAGQ